MDPKQTPPLGNAQTSGQEGQPVGAPTSGATSGVFKMAGDLGAENLSTGANVSRTMDSLNNANQSATGAPVFAKHKFDKIEYATGDIIVDNNDAKPKPSFFGFFGSSKKNGPKVKSAAEITREARREAKRLRKLNAGKGNGSMVEPASAATAAQPVPAPAASTPTPTPAPTSASKPQTTKRTKLIVGALVAILVIVAGVLGVIALTNNKSSTKRPAVSTTITAEAALTDYLSYLFYGDDVPSGDLLTNLKKTWEEYFHGDWEFSNTEEGTDVLTNSPIYAERMMARSSSATERSEYFDNLNKKWLEFIELYDGALVDMDLSDIYLYFHDIASVKKITEEEIITMAYYGAQSAESEAAILDVDSESLEESDAWLYAEAAQNYYNAFLDLVKKADSHGCLTNSIVQTDGECGRVLAEALDNTFEKQLAYYMSEVLIRAQSSARETLDTLLSDVLEIEEVDDIENEESTYE